MIRALLLVALLGAPAAYAETLRWAADFESGAPYSFKDPADPTKVIGFEAEMVQALADDMGMQLETVQNNWEGLVEGLARHDYDIVVNGLEITPDRAQIVDFSQPYYYTAQVLAVRRDDDKITKLSDAEGLKIGTLAGSLAQRILARQSFPLQVVTYNEEIHIYNDLANGRLDAVLLDEAIALYYGKPNPELKLVGAPIGEMEYGIATNKDNPKLRARVRASLDKIIKSGKMRHILERWGLWNALTAGKWGMGAEFSQAPEAYDNYLRAALKPISFGERVQRYISFLPLLAKGAWMTLQISIVSMVLAMIIGLMTALARLYGARPVAWLAVAYVEILRGTPLLIQLFLIFYGLPHVGIRLDPYLAAVLGLGLNYGASEAENYRAGILSIPHAQMDASQALGMSQWQSLRYVILPQAVRVVIPPVTNDFIALLKDSSLVSVITMVELTSTYGQLASTYFDYLGIGLLTAAAYFLIGLPFVRLSRHFEATMNVHQKKGQSRSDRPFIKRNKPTIS